MSNKKNLKFAKDARKPSYLSMGGHEQNMWSSIIKSTIHSKLVTVKTKKNKRKKYFDSKIF